MRQAIFDVPTSSAAIVAERRGDERLQTRRNKLGLHRL